MQSEYSIEYKYVNTSQINNDINSPQINNEINTPGKSNLKQIFNNNNNLGDS